MDISSVYTDLYSKEAANSKSAKLSNSIKNKDFSGSTDEELMDVCKQFESYFVEQVLKEAKKAFTNSEESSDASMNTMKSYYDDILVQKYAETITSKEDLGLAKILYEQMKRNYSPDDIKKVDEATDDNAVMSDVEIAEDAATKVI